MATIYCFTSTGNSLYTANAIADKIGGKVLPMRGKLGRMGEQRLTSPFVCEDDVIGFVFPCYFWGLPRMVEGFVSKMLITNKDAYVFAVLTCGGPVFGVLGLLKRLLKTKDIRLWYGEGIISVSNYLPEYKANDSEALREKIDAQIHTIANAINNKEEKRVTALPFLNKLLYKFCPGENSDQCLSISSSCSGCATCQKVCPADNITIKAGKPVFQHKCEHCLACLHNCPARAIDWKDKTHGKERYRNAKVSLDDLIAFNNCFDEYDVSG